MDNENLEYVLPVERNDVKYTEKRKKNGKIALLCIAAFVVFVVVCVVLSFLFPKSIKGSWELVENPEIVQASPDQIEDADRVFYTFTKPGAYGDGKWTTYFNGGVEVGDYKLSEKDGKEYIDMGSGEFEYVITGSKLLGNCKLTVIYPEYTDEETGATTPAQHYVFVQKKAPEYSDESYDDYKTDKALVGEWITNERTLSYFTYILSYVESVDFSDNGVMTIHYESEDLALDRYMYYAYTAQNNELTFSLVTDKETKYTVQYSFDENGNLKFLDDTTTDSIFADEFFSDVTYYTPDNLPESSATSDEATSGE